jgi:outer membrane protein TolC
MSPIIPSQWLERSSGHRRSVLASVLLFTLATGPVSAATLAEAVDAALALAAEQPRVAALRNEGSAIRLQAASLTAEHPAARLKALSDGLTGDDGAYELEAMLDLPLWLPGQRASRLAVAQSIGLRADGLERLLRWEMAGQVREQVWEVALADGRLRQSAAAVAEAKALERTVSKRAAAGELARMDLLLARQETMDRGIELQQAQLDRDQAVAALEQLTGSPALPLPLREPAPAAGADPVLPEDHPLLALAAGEVGQARAERERAAADGPGHPILSLGGKRARDARGLPADDALQLELSIPFGTRRHAAPEIASAEREYTDRLTELHGLRRQAERDLRQSLLARDGATDALSAAERGAEVAGEALAITRRAFELGEADLSTLLRAEGRAREARLNLELRRLDVGRADARLNQALGVVPK